MWVSVLLQAPGSLLAGLRLWILVHWGWLSGGWGLGLFLGWILKDCASAWRGEPVPQGEGIAAGRSVIVRAVRVLTLLLDAEDGPPPAKAKA